MALFDFLVGSNKMKKNPTLSKEQQQLLSQLVNMLGGEGGQSFQSGGINRKPY